MLVSHKQEYYAYQQEQSVPSARAQKSLNVKLRAKCLLLFVMVSFMAMFITIRSEVIVRKGYSLVELKAQIITLEKQNEQLRLDIAKMKSPERIQHIATKELGMIVPSTIYCAAVTDKNGSKEPSKEANEQKTLVGKAFNILKLNKAEASKGR